MNFQTNHDVRSYLKKIYGLPILDVRTRIEMGSTQRDKVVGYVTKEDDVKLAYVTLPKELNFEWPELFPSDAETKKQRREDEKSLETSKEVFKKYLEKSKARKGLPGWYSI